MTPEDRIKNDRLWKLACRLLDNGYVESAHQHISIFTKNDDQVYIYWLSNHISVYIGGINIVSFVEVQF